MQTSLQQCADVVRQLESERQELKCVEALTRQRNNELNEQFSTLITKDFTVERLESLNNELHTTEQLLEQQSSKLKAATVELAAKKAQREIEKSQIQLECIGKKIIF